jgi:ABC-type multidrug transport system ATPase subunit
MIRLCDIRFSYGHGHDVLKGVGMEIGPGLTLLVGPNGCGKSTLLKIIAGIERPDSGSAHIEGVDLWKNEVAARRRLAYVSEQPDLTPYATIRDVIYLVCRLRSQAPEQGRVALQRAGLAGLENRSIRELSMGQRRRAVLAAAWVGTPRVVILDEPLESMDRAIREQIMDWLENLLAQGAAVMIATHQVEPFIEWACRAVTIRDGLCRVAEPLPTVRTERVTLLDAFSRGR